MTDRLIAPENADVPRTLTRSQVTPRRRGLVGGIAATARAEEGAARRHDGPRRGKRADVTGCAPTPPPKRGIAAVSARISASR